MEGLDTMLGHILKDARQEAQTQVEQAQKQALEILEDYRSRERKQTRQLRHESRDAVAQLLRKARSRAEQERHQALLSARQAEIQDGMRLLYHRLCQMAPEPYFEFLYHLLGQVLTPGTEGELWLNAQDLKRMPLGYGHRLKKLASEKQAKLTLSEQAADMEGGFLLVSGGITENCSLHSLLESGKAEKTARLAWLLFEGAEA